MITRQQTYLEFLSTPRVRMAIPVFQRVYTWGVWQCDELFEDIIKAGSSEEDHFIGSIVYTKEELFPEHNTHLAEPSDATEKTLSIDCEDAGKDGNKNASPADIDTSEKISLFNIVDGQQRTTTTYLLLIALRDYLQEHNSKVCNLSPEDIEDTYLYMDIDALDEKTTESVQNAPDGSAATTKDASTNKTQAQPRTLKFIAAPADKATLAAILNKTPMPESYLVSKCVVDNYNYFKEMLPKTNLDVMWRGLSNLFAIVVELGQTDNPQLIFEGINSKGMSLATSDLLRNRMFFEQDTPTQERLLSQYWEPLEALFEDDPTQNHFNAAIRRWLVEQDSSLEDRSRWELYSVFRKYIDKHYPNSTEKLMQELLESCTEFKHMIKSPPMRKHLDWAEGHTEFNGASGHTMFG